MVDRELSTSVSMETVKDVLYRAGEITTKALEASELESADVVIRPQVGDLHWMDFRQVARESLEKIKDSLLIYGRIIRFAERYQERIEGVGILEISGRGNF